MTDLCKHDVLMLASSDCAVRGVLAGLATGKM